MSKGVRGVCKSKEQVGGDDSFKQEKVSGLDVGDTQSSKCLLDLQVGTSTWIAVQEESAGDAKCQTASGFQMCDFTAGTSLQTQL